ncbi:hypothetical protein NDU88_005178 [Pleurodeles waltl]|uniref:Uncharacterized protein n=1 Tax=Pleurodeles waltl TaxID=8319 RepID=A0AAV7L200_PLEWA|nr:hypothetical protein NDU88_005178 [Pleurodeles waltl]
MQFLLSFCCSLRFLPGIKRHFVGLKQNLKTNSAFAWKSGRTLAKTNLGHSAHLRTSKSPPRVQAWHLIQPQPSEEFNRIINARVFNRITGDNGLRIKGHLRQQAELGICAIKGVAPQEVISLVQAQKCVHFPPAEALVLV